uniref:Uncharacterized protein n=1 Tax=Romanomermis culicivorax TaxID=13658 RepID=A0A915J5D0_ROMCU
MNVLFPQPREIGIWVDGICILNKIIKANEETLESLIGCGAINYEWVHSNDNCLDWAIFFMQWLRCRQVVTHNGSSSGCRNKLLHLLGEGGEVRIGGLNLFLDLVLDAMCMVAQNVSLYMRNSVVNSIKVIDEDLVDFPAVTICSQITDKRVPTCDFPENVCEVSFHINAISYEADGFFTALS